MGLGPHPPHRPPHRDDAFASARPCLLATAGACARTRDRTMRNELPLAVSRVLSSQGVERFRLPSPPIRAASSTFTSVKLVDARGWELCPDSIRSDTSCRAIAALPVGLPAPLSASLAEAALPTKRFRRARSPPHERVAKRRARDPPDRPAFAGRPDANRHPPERGD